MPYIRKHLDGWRNKVNKIAKVILLASAALSIPPAEAEFTLLVDQVGYDSTTQKIALLEGTREDAVRSGSDLRFDVIDTSTGKPVLTGTAVFAGRVYDWGNRVFWNLDFSSLKTPGHYRLSMHMGQRDRETCEFSVDDDLLERSTLSNVLFYFKGQRASGAITVLMAT